MAPLKRGERRAAASGAVVRKIVYLHRDEAEAVRVCAFKDNRSQAAVMREPIRRYLKIED